ncbi:MAG: hypothetical protein ACK587_14150 [Cyanobacteriota bacterium]
MAQPTVGLKLEAFCLRRISSLDPAAGGMGVIPKDAAGRGGPEPGSLRVAGRR